MKIFLSALGGALLLCTGAFAQSSLPQLLQEIQAPDEMMPVEPSIIEVGFEYRINPCAFVDPAPGFVCIPTENGGFVVLPIDEGLYEIGLA